MVETQLAARDITDPRVLGVFRDVPRHAFVPDSQKAFAYEDRPLPIGRSQTISQPYMMAYIVQNMALKGDEIVLEVGCGSGYLAAVLGRLAKQVYTIDRYPEFVYHARAVYKQLGITNVEVIEGEGLRGYPEAAQYDVILVSAHGPSVPETLLDQLKIGGALFMPIGPPTVQTLYKIIKQLNGFQEVPLGECRFVPLVVDVIEGVDDDYDGELEEP